MDLLSQLIASTLPAVVGVGALWLNTRKDRRESRRDELALDRDMRGDLDAVMAQLLAIRRGFFALAGRYRLDAVVALRDGKTDLADAYRHVADDIEAVLVAGPETT